MKADDQFMLRACEAHIETGRSTRSVLDRDDLVRRMRLKARGGEQVRLQDHIVRDADDKGEGDGALLTKTAIDLMGHTCGHRLTFIVILPRTPIYFSWGLSDVSFSDASIRPRGTRYGSHEWSLFVMSPFPCESLTQPSEIVLMSRHYQIASLRGAKQELNFPSRDTAAPPGTASVELRHLSYPYLRDKEHLL
jgi:hypothetical protein